METAKLTPILKERGYLLCTDGPGVCTLALDEIHELQQMEGIATVSVKTGEGSFLHATYNTKMFSEDDMNFRILHK